MPKKHHQNMREGASSPNPTGKEKDRGLSVEPTVEEQFLDAYNRLADKVFRRILFKTSSKEAAKDLTQDVFLKTWDYMSEKGREVKYINSFVYTVTSNLIKDYYKYKKKKPILLGEMKNYDAHDIPDVQNLLHTVEVSHIARALEDLDEPYQSVVRMRVFEGRSPADIAEETGERPNTISVRLHRGLAVFRALLTKERRGNIGGVPRGTK